MTIMLNHTIVPVRDKEASAIWERGAVAIGWGPAEGRS